MSYKQQIIDCIKEGMTAKEIAATVGCSLVNVYRTSEKAGIPVHRQRVHRVQINGSVASITDNYGHEILLDVEDLNIIEGKSIDVNERGYVTVYRGNERARLHRILMGIVDQPDKMADHINRNPLDNRRENLRVCTVRENNFNRDKCNNNKAGLKGVSTLAEPKGGKQYRASIWKDGKKHYLGYFDNADDAHRAYVEAARELYGEYSPL